MEPNENMVVYLATSELIKTLKENSKLLAEAKLYDMNTSAKFKLQPGINGARALKEIASYSAKNNGCIICVNKDESYQVHLLYTEEEDFPGGEFIYVCL